MRRAVISSRGPGERTGGAHRRRYRAAVVGVAATALLLTACGDSDDEGGGTPVADASITYGSPAITTTLDPHAATSSVGRTYAKQVFDQLVRFDATGELQPGLATEWERVDDDTVELTLREGAEFTTGDPADAEAVRANVERIMSGDPTFSLISGRLGTIKDAEVVSPTVVRINTDGPDAVLLNRLTMFDIVAPKTFKKAATEAAGSGPFKVTSYKPSEEIVLERNDDSWRATDNVKDLKLVAIPDPSTLADAVRTDEVDIAFGISTDAATQLEGEGYRTTTRSAGSAAINSLITDAEPKLEDPRVREAINLAINREEFVLGALGGFGEPNGSQLLQPGYFGYDDSIEAFGYDPDRAKQLISEAGVEGLELPIATTALFKSQAEAVAGYLNAVGFKSEVVIQELSAFVPTLLQKSEYPLLYWQTDYFDLRDITSVTRLGLLQPGQQPHFDSPEYRDLFAEQVTQLDETEREATIKQMANILRDEIGVLFLAWPHNVYSSNERVGDLPLAGDSLVNVEEVVVTD